MNTLETIKRARELGACPGALDWLETLPPDANPWEICERGDWMLWFAVKLGVDRKLVVIAACKCARLALVYVPDGELRPQKAIETAEAWARGEASLDDVRAAVNAANAAAAAAEAAAAADVVYAYAAYADAAAAAAGDAAGAVYADAAAAYAAAAVGAANAAYAAAAANAAYAKAAANAAAAAADADAYKKNRKETLNRCEDIVREVIPSIDEVI